MRRSFGRLEAVRCIAPVEKDFGLLFAAVNLAVRCNDRQRTQVLNTVDGSRLRFSVKGVLRGLPGKIELVPLHVGVVRTVKRMDAPTVLPASDVVADLHDDV